MALSRKCLIGIRFGKAYFESSCEMDKWEHRESGTDEFVFIQRDSEVFMQMACPLLEEQEEADSNKWRKCPEVCLEMLSLNHNSGKLFWRGSEFASFS